MSSAMGSAEYKRKAEPDALASPYAKKIVSSDALPKEDKTPLEDSSDITENDKDVLEGSDSPASDEESDITDDEVDLLDPCFIVADKLETIFRYTTEIGDFQALCEELARIHGCDSELYRKQYPIAVGSQETLEVTARMTSDLPVKMLHVQTAFHMDGNVFSACAVIREM